MAEVPENVLPMFSIEETRALTETPKESWDSMPDDYKARVVTRLIDCIKSIARRNQNQGIVRFIALLDVVETSPVFNGVIRGRHDSTYETPTVMPTFLVDWMQQNRYSWIHPVEVVVKSLGKASDFDTAVFLIQL